MTIEDTMRSYRGGGGLYSNAVRFCDDLDGTNWDRSLEVVHSVEKTISVWEKK